MAQRPTHGQLRVIGGQWRGRRLTFPAIPGLRPTPDRVRETLFNWLRDIIPAAHCLDLCAGSGLLGIEALSRGAAHVSFVDCDARAMAAIRTHLLTLGATAHDQAHLYTQDAVAFLAEPSPARFDVVYLDPPFAQAHVLNQCITALDKYTGLNDTAWIYLEAPVDQILVLPPSWLVSRQARAGEVGFYLIRRTMAASPHVAAPTPEPHS